MRSSAEIKKEIETKFGFFPPFFAPALDTPEILENLWAQTLSSYIENPIPELFKEKLAASLARFCLVPYCLVCHSAMLRPLGMPSSAVLAMLETPPLNYEELSRKTALLTSPRISGWPEEGSNLENAILSCCVAIFLNQDTEQCQQRLRQILEPKYYNYLCIYLAYNRTALNWAEMHPEIAYSEDQRVKNSLAKMLDEEPGLKDFFANYQQRIAMQADRHSYWLTSENKRILASERRLLQQVDTVTKQLQDFFMQAPEPMAMFSGPEHVFTLVNPPYVHFIGRDPVGHKVREVFSEEEAGEFFGLLDNVYQTGIPHIGRELPFKRRGANGEFEGLWINIGYYAARDVEQNITGIMAFVYDVTAQVEARHKVEASARQVRRYAEAMPQMAFIADGNGEIEYFNYRFYDYIGSAPGLTEGRKWETQAIHHPDDLERTIAAWNHSVKTGDPYEIEYRLRRFDGTYRWHLARAVPEKNEEGEVVQWFGTNTDIHDQKMLSSQLQEAKESADAANASKSSFLANMSHEIRTPLGAIMGFAELLKGSDTTKSDVDEFANVIERNSTHLLRIIDDILDLSKVEAGKMLIEQIDFSLDDLLAEFSNIMNFRAKDKGIQYELKIADSVPEFINSDPTRLRQVLSNVVGNAIKFTDQGLVELAVDCVGDHLRFTVTDTGTGLSPKQAAGLFQPFHQADVSTTRKFGGTGLGLVLARSLSEALGGKFYLEGSELGKGSTFVATIKIVNPKFRKGTSWASATSLKAKSSAPGASFLNEKSGELSGLKVLIVEDSEDNQVLFSRLLTSSGATVEIADNGRDGIVMAKAKAYDVILMDIQMPIMDGHRASKTLRGEGYEGAIVALTAHAMNEERERARDSGFTDYLSKPVQRDLLMDLLKKFVPN